MFLLIADALLVVWIYLVFMVRKKKTNIFHDQMEPKLAERRLKRLKAFLLVAGISFAMLCVSMLLAGPIFHPPEEVMDNVVRYIEFSLSVVFTIATIGGLVIFPQGRRKTT